VFITSPAQIQLLQRLYIRLQASFEGCLYTIEIMALTDSQFACQVVLEPCQPQLLYLLPWIVVVRTLPRGCKHNLHVVSNPYLHAVYKLECRDLSRVINKYTWSYLLRV
jgi:hypothetical protein